MGTATYGVQGLKEKTTGSGERPMDAASFGEQSIQASCQPPTPPSPLPTTLRSGCKVTDSAQEHNR